MLHICKSSPNGGDLVWRALICSSATCHLFVVTLKQESSYSNTDCIIENCSWLLSLLPYPVTWFGRCGLRRWNLHCKSLACHWHWSWNFIWDRYCLWGCCSYNEQIISVRWLIYFYSILHSLQEYTFKVERADGRWENVSRKEGRVI